MAETKAKARQYQRVSELLPESKLWPDLTRRDKKDLQDLDFVLVEAEQRTSRLDGRLSTYMVCKCADVDSGEEFTTILGGEVIFPKVTLLKEQNLIPCIVRIVRPDGKRYFDIE